MKFYTDAHIPAPHPTRPGWLCIPAAGGGSIGWKAGIPPNIRLKHIDGPLLIFSDGQLHWLTLWERFLFKLGWTDAEKIQRKRRPNLCKSYVVMALTALERNDVEKSGGSQS